MRYKRKIVAHVEERVIDSRETCDSCGKEIDDGPGLYDLNEVAIEAKIGAFYPSSDVRTIYEIDVCADCFTEKLLPLMRANSFPVRERDAEIGDGRQWDPEA